MFERYTEKARRVIFFARYEASQFGSKEIDTGHLLLGLLRESRSLYRWLPKANPATLRQEIIDHLPRAASISTAIDLPLSPAARRVLKFALDEAELLQHKHIGTEHLFMGLLDEAECFAAKVLREGGADANGMRLKLAELSNEQLDSLHFKSIPGRDYRSAFTSPIVIRGIPLHGGHVRDAIQRCRMYNWHWNKRPWTNIDIVIERKTGKVSFDLRLAENSENFELVKGGWKKDRCVICRWELFEPQNDTDADHGAGYTNGRDWLCTECYKKLWQDPDFLSSRYSDIT